MVRNACNTTWFCRITEGGTPSPLGIRVPLYFEMESRILIDYMFKNKTLRTLLQYVPSLVLTMETFP